MTIVNSSIISLITSADYASPKAEFTATISEDMYKPLKQL